MILAALVMSVLPGSLPPGLLRPYYATSPAEQNESSKEQAEAEQLKLLNAAQRRAHAGPTRAWLRLTSVRRQAPSLRPPVYSYDYEDPRRVLIPLRIDPPPDGRA